MRKGKYLKKREPVLNKAMRKGKYSKKREPVLNKAMSLAVVLFWLVIITTYMSSGLYAKYSTMGAGGDEARVIRFGELTVTETLDTGITTTGGNLIFVPGTTLQKKLTVDFEGSEAATFVFVELDTTGWDFTPQNATNGATLALKQDGNILLFWKVADGWEYLASDGNKHVFYTALEPNEALTEKDFIAGGKITVSVATYDAYDALRGVDLKVNVTAYAVQANGFAVSNNMEDNVIAAWNSIKNK